MYRDVFNVFNVPKYDSIFVCIESSSLDYFFMVRFYNKLKYLYGCVSFSFVIVTYFYYFSVRLFTSSKGYLL